MNFRVSSSDVYILGRDFWIFDSADRTEQILGSPDLFFLPDPPGLWILRSIPTKSYRFPISWAFYSLLSRLSISGANLSVRWCITSPNALKQLTQHRIREKLSGWSGTKLSPICSYLPGALTATGNCFWSKRIPETGSDPQDASSLSFPVRHFRRQKPPTARVQDERALAANASRWRQVGDSGTRWETHL